MDSSDSDEEPLQVLPTRPVTVPPRSVTIAPINNASPLQVDRVYQSMLHKDTSDVPNISLILRQAVTSNTWEARRRTMDLIQRHGCLKSDPVRAIDAFLGHRSSSVAAATMIKDVSNLKFLIPRLIPTEQAQPVLCLLEDIQRGLRRSNALTPKTKALPMSKAALRRLLPTLPRKLQVLALLAFRTASRVGDLTLLRKCDIIFQGNSLLVSFRVTKTNHDAERRPDHKIVINDPEPILQLQLRRLTPNQDQLWSSEDINELRKALRQFKPTPDDVRTWRSLSPDEIVRDHYTFHSFKRGAAALAWQALADRKISTDDLLLLLKHQSIKSSLEYCPVPMIAAKAIGSRATALTALDRPSSTEL